MIFLHGETVDSRDIKKHLKDICELFQIIFLDTGLLLPKIIAQDISLFLEKATSKSTLLEKLSPQIIEFYHLNK